MPRYAQLVMGPAGSGKSTYCSNMVKHCNALRRSVSVVNLDPAAEYFDYPVTADIRDLIELKDVMEEDDLHFGPNGGLVFCMEYLAQNWEWLHEAIGEDEDGDYILFDCPGQIELYTHVPVMTKLIEQLQNWGFMLCSVFLLESQFLVEPSKFLAGSLTALSAMVNLAVPHVNIASKLDLLSKQAKKNLDRYLEPSMEELLDEEFNDKAFSHRFKKLNTAFAKVLDDFRMVKFMPLDPSDEGTIDDILAQIDTCMQYGEELEHLENRAQDNAEADPDFGETDSGYGGVGE